MPHDSLVLYISIPLKNCTRTTPTLSLGYFNVGIVLLLAILFCYLTLILWFAPPLVFMSFQKVQNV